MNPLSLLAFLQVDAGAIAEGADSIFSALSTPLIVIFVVVAFGLLIRTAAKRYIKVPPDKALVVFGKNTQVIAKGAKFIIPLFQEYYIMDLSLFQMDLNLVNVPNADGVQVTVKAVATCKIGNTDDLLNRAAENFGRATRDEVKDKIHNALEGHLRVIIGQIDMDTILRKRDEFNQRIQTEAAQEVEGLGCTIKILNIQEVSDKHGYIEALGKPKTAEVLAEANIKEAQQKRREKIDTTNAQREAEKIAAENEAQIAEANRDLEKKKAQYKAEVDREQATAAQAGPLANASARRAVVEAEVAVEKSKTIAEIELQDAVAKKTKAELNATVIEAANAERDRQAIEAEGIKKRLIIEAEGQSEARKTIAEAEKLALEAEGDGESKKTRLIGIAKADAEEAGLVAQAKGKEAQAAAEKAELLARAEGRRQLLLAEAEGEEKRLLAQATGMKELMAAYENLTDGQRQLLQLQWMLEAMPDMVDKLGEAGQRIMSEIAQATVAGLSQIDSLTVYDSSPNGHGALGRVAAVGPDTMFKALMGLKETGMLPAISGALSKMGIDVSSILGGNATNGVVSEDLKDELIGVEK